MEDRLIIMLTVMCVLYMNLLENWKVCVGRYQPKVGSHDW
jgi:hypothetical protein